MAGAGSILAFALGTITAQIWGQTNCSFYANGQGQCETGDCNGLLGCQGRGSPPNTLAEFSSNQFNMDFQDISLVDGFNLPMHLRPTTGASRGIKCSDDINSQCPAKLKAPGGCNNPCTVFKTNEHCCTNGPGSCTSSQFFKDRCPDAYTYPLDDPATFTCPSGTNSKVTFCP